MNNTALLAKIDDLIIQATKERSHYYTASVLRECREALTPPPPEPTNMVWCRRCPGCGATFEIKDGHSCEWLTVRGYDYEASKENK